MSESLNISKAGRYEARTKGRLVTALFEASRQWEIWNLARRGEYMTNQCKFGMGNYLFIPSAGNTCTSVMKCVKLFSLQNHRPQRKRTEYCTVYLNSGQISKLIMRRFPIFHPLFFFLYSFPSLRALLFPF